MIMDLFDNLAYFGNWPDRLLTMFVQATSPSKGGRFGGLVQFKVPHPNKNDKSPGVVAVKAHLKRHGVRTFLYLHDANYMYFSVRETQAEYARWLYDEENMLMRNTATRWSDPTPKVPAKRAPARRAGTKRKQKAAPKMGTARGFVEYLIK